MKRVLIANRGEIALRVIRACQARGLETVAVYSEADATSLHVRSADQAFCVGPAAPLESYLNQDALLDACRRSGADAVHPGYGFLSENTDFAERIEQAGLTWIGPRAGSIRAMGDKVTARRTMERAGVPVVPGCHDNIADDQTLRQAAERIGFPLLVKAAAGGGGKGMRIVRDAAGFSAAVDASRREARSAFGNDTVYLEKLIEQPRHVEFQVFGDAHGNLIHLLERECSIQRRHQKILEESPSPVLSETLRKQMGEAAVAAASSVNYLGAGTIEFLLDGDQFYFLEMNTRLQVEHPVTEMRLGVDLVAAQLAVAAGERLPWSAADLKPRGHAIEVRLYAEDPARGFLPASGTLLRYRVPNGPGIRHDGGFSEGDEVSTHYDPMLAKLTVWAADRTTCVNSLRAALDRWQIHGVTTNLGFLQTLCRHPEFLAGNTFTDFIERNADTLKFDPPTVDRETLIALALAQTMGLDGSGSVGTTQKAAGDSFSPWQSVGPWRGGAS